MTTHNQEDETLFKLLGDRPPGFYVDVGANDPINASNTHSFYMKGWRGIDIEPLPDKAARLREVHSENITVECAVGHSAGSLLLYVPRDQFYSELTTANADIAAKHVRDGFGDFDKIVVELRTLDDILAEHADRPIDFMSMDVEGSELSALNGFDLGRWKPDVLLIEATLPNTRIPCWDAWEPIILAAGYKFATFDGYNRFYTR